MIEVVGIGPGYVNLMTFEVRKVIGVADAVVGGRRNIEEIKGILNDDVEVCFITKDLESVKAFIAERVDKNIVVVASGDPSLYGISNYILRNFDEKFVNIRPGISAVQYLFSKAKISMNDVYITSGHGKVPDFDKIISMDKVAMVTDLNYSVSNIASKLEELGDLRTVIVGENLASKEEKIHKLSLKEASEMEFSPLTSVIFIRQDSIKDREQGNR